MTATLTIRDETPGQTTFHEWSLEVLTERMTVRELIRSRVYQEVQDFNQRGVGDYRGLIQPTDAERTLNGSRLRHPREISFPQQLSRAIEAFESSQVLVLINDRQVDALDEETELKPGTTVTFLRLTLLVGG